MLPMPTEDKICALVAAYNEAEFIGPVIRGVKEQVTTVILVDDGSDDGTHDIAAGAGAVCLRQDHNQGKGAALRAGIAHINKLDFSHVLFIDGDGQHSPEDIPSLIRVARETNADMVIGARSFDKDRMPRERYYSNIIGSKFASWLIGREIKDSQSGFRLVRSDKLKGLILRARKYEIEMEILIKMILAGCSIAQTPVRIVYESGNARSKMKPIRDTIRTCFLSLFFRVEGLTSNVERRTSKV
jgi:glycosyltransferase involved in cell wall biosynthesis